MIREMAHLISFVDDDFICLKGDFLRKPLVVITSVVRSRCPTPCARRESSRVLSLAPDRRGSNCMYFETVGPFFLTSRWNQQLWLFYVYIYIFIYYTMCIYIYIYIVIYILYLYPIGNSSSRLNFWGWAGWNKTGIWDTWRVLPWYI